MIVDWTVKYLPSSIKLTSTPFPKGNDKMESDRKGFDNLANKEQGEQQKKAEEENVDKEQAGAKEDVPSCQHQDRRDLLGKENQAESEKNKEKDGIMAACCFLCLGTHFNQC